MATKRGRRPLTCPNGRSRSRTPSNGSQGLLKPRNPADVDAFEADSGSGLDLDLDLDLDRNRDLVAPATPRGLRQGWNRIWAWTWTWIWTALNRSGQNRRGIAVSGSWH